MAATARPTQPAERKALNLVVVGSSPTVGAIDIAERSGEEEDKGGWGGKGEQGKEERRRRRGGGKEVGTEDEEEMCWVELLWGLVCKVCWKCACCMSHMEAPSA